MLATAFVDLNGAPLAAHAFTNFPEADGLLADLMVSLRAEGMLATLFFDDDSAPVPLYRAGTVALDPHPARRAVELASALVGRDAGRRDETVSLHGAGSTGGQSDLLSICIPCAVGGTHLVITAVMDQGHTSRPALALATLKRAAPTLGAAFALWQRHRLGVQERQGLGGVLDAFDFGIIVVDRDGEIGYTNAAANRLLSEGRLIRRRGRSLAAGQIGDAMRLQAALGAAVAANNSAPSLIAGAGDPDLLQLTAGRERVVIAALPANGPPAEPGAAAAVLFVHNPDRQSERLVAPVCRLFGLSAVETRLACHLVAGRSVTEASQVMRIKEQTARGYLKQVFLKADVTRQSDLIRLLLSHILPTRARETLGIRQLASPQMGATNLPV